MQIDAVACRMSRAALDWTQMRLAREAHVAVRVVLQFENGSSTPRRNNLRELVLAFENAGVEFLVHGTRILVLPPLSPVPKAIARGLSPLDRRFGRLARGREGAPRP